MAKAPYTFSHRTSAVSLFSLYSLISALPSALLIWAASFGGSTPSGLAQTAPEAPLSDSSQAQRTEAQDLLEQARQRLLDRDLPSTEQGRETGDRPSSPQLDAYFDAYRLGPGDSIFVNVLRFPDLSFQPTLDLQGNVVVPLVGSLSLEGFTIEQAEQSIQTALNRYVIDPEVDVTLVAQRPVQVTIAGEVVKPGVYPLNAPQLEVALLTAGGTTRLADLRTVRIRRTLIDGTVLERDIDLYSPLRNSTAVPRVRLEDGDSIIVPALNAETIATYDRTLVARSTLSQQEMVIRVLNYASGGGGRGGGGATIGSIRLPSGSSFLDAVTTIGISPDRADLRDVAVVRFDPIQGRAVTQELDAKDALLGDMSQNPPLENNDVIVVGRNLISRITYALNTFTQPFRDVLGFLLFFDEIRDNADNLFGPGGDNDDDDDDDN
jgi:polysaccharide biosynthesis/export protein